jgi:hypothetical protein
LVFFSSGNSATGTGYLVLDYFTMAPQLDYVFTMRAYLSRENGFTISKLKDGPSRVVLPITHGFIDGSGIKATIIPGGGDWILVSPGFSYSPAVISGD